uniref:Uncharacterized protein n=1 Tax=Serinus canaria TaxID=9135 RepID=A0A8C9UEU4_SERCA
FFHHGFKVVLPWALDVHLSWWVRGSKDTWHSGEPCLGGQSNTAPHTATLKNHFNSPDWKMSACHHPV